MNRILRHPLTIALCLIIAGMIIAAGILLSKGSPEDVSSENLQGASPVPTAAVTPVKTVQSTPAVAGPKITYVVTGSPAHISFGPNGEEHASVPLNKTEAIGGNQYLSLIVTMDQGGTKTKVVAKVDGKVVGRIYATTDHPIASIMVNKAYDTGKWIGVTSTSS